MSAPAKTASKAAVNLLSPVADQEPELLGLAAKVHQQVAGLLSDPGTSGVGGDPRDVYAAVALLDHDQDVEAAQEDGVDVGEAAGDVWQRHDCTTGRAQPALGAPGSSGSAACPPHPGACSHPLS
jgi:hypothetical protein